MTCEEFKQTMKSDFFNSTAALRAAFYRHTKDCPDCCKLVDDMPDLDSEISPLVNKFMHQIAKSDRKDPETQF